MQQVITDFEERVQEVENYFLGLKKLNTNGTSLDLSQPILADFLDIIKANSFVILYNLIEFAIREGILEIYQQIQNQNYCYQQLSPKLRKIWIDYRYRKVFNPAANWNTARHEATLMIDEVIGQAVTQLESPDKKSNAIPISGNLDAREIRRICELHGISHQVSPNARGGNKLKSVKEMRNALAHGNRSFPECGRNFTVTELENIKNETIIFVRDILNNMEYYANNKQYLSTSMSP